MSLVADANLYIVNTSDEPNNVIFGHATFAKNAGLTPIFVFPSRAGAQNNEAYYLDYQTIRLNFTFKVDNPLVYILSLVQLIYFVTRTFAFQKEAQNFLAIDLLGTMACFLLKLRKVKIHTLLNDNFSARYKMSSNAFFILRALEASVLRYVSTSCIFPDKSRYELLGSPRISDLYFIPNVLKDDYVPTYKGARSSNLIVIFCGWLDLSRGIELLTDILNNTDDSVEFKLVGFGNESQLEALCSNKRVKYLGHVTRHENLRLMSDSDINIALYNPDILINRYALPQKVYDSLMIGCPLLVNSEVKMSEHLNKNQACFRLDYYDVEAISQLLNDLIRDKSALKKMSSSMLNYYSKFTSFKRTESIGNSVYSKIFSKANLET